jgi:hypothetical protein
VEEEKYLIPIPSSLPCGRRKKPILANLSHLGGGSEWLLRSTCEVNDRLIIGPITNHRPIECSPAPILCHHITKGSPTFDSFLDSVLSRKLTYEAYKKAKSTDGTKDMVRLSTGSLAQ